MSSLNGKVAIITGGSKGIGKAIALIFAESGAFVAIASRKMEELEKVSEELKSKGLKCLAIPAHVAQPEDTKTLVDRVINEWGKVDILVNNAGTNPFAGEMADLEEWAWDVTMNVNLKGPFFLTQMIGKIMRERGGGSIVNVASTAGLKPSELGIYSVSKAALIMLTQILAKEWAKYNIRVNALAPGIINTRMTAMLRKDAESAEHTAKHIPIGRMGEPEEVARAALFLASDDASYVTGSLLPVEGGNLLIGNPVPILGKTL